MTNYTIDENAKFIAKQIEAIYGNFYDEGEYYKKRIKGSSGGRIYRIQDSEKLAKTDVTQLTDNTAQINTNFTPEEIESSIVEKFNISTGNSTSMSRSMSQRDTYTDRSKDNNNGVKKGRKAESSKQSNYKAGSVIDTHEDGSITMMPAFTKEEAMYEQHSSSRKNCKECVHYLEGGGCSIVQGNIEPDAHCDNFYADVGIFANNVEDVEINLKLWGERYNFSEGEVMELVNIVKESLTER